MVVVEQFQRLHTVGSSQRLIARSLFTMAQSRRAVLGSSSAIKIRNICVSLLRAIPHNSV